MASNGSDVVMMYGTRRCWSRPSSPSQRLSLSRYCLICSPLKSENLAVAVSEINVTMDTQVICFFSQISYKSTNEINGKCIRIEDSKSETDVDVDYNSLYSKQGFLQGEVKGQLENIHLHQALCPDEPLLVRAARGEDGIPHWMMRQAERYMAEYQASAKGKLTFGHQVRGAPSCEVLRNSFQILTASSILGPCTVSLSVLEKEGVVFSVRPTKKSWKNISNISCGEKLQPKQ
ncbi:hypothetical protein Zm00014a_016760 [Zea mays]|uniref:Uncharacterized protein n=1 Tax=Zea mays TaxID=4577 RepID=A0A3L6EU09_MAIZE|nr:hypothetical protein Zm00014a_016760 [Zea mays]